MINMINLGQTVFHQTTPEPSSLAMLGGAALAGIGYAGSRMIRKV
ncbi:MAG: PEP-CTERM sorting domain-containing protein [Nanoarchaeota archaeon]|nr:PEP-CTERM sorting domain-containing protein [Nanoarchaeota archaeon]